MANPNSNSKEYVFVGSHVRPWDNTERLVLEGPAAEPERWLDRDGDPGALTQDELKSLIDDGWVFREEGDEEEIGDDENTEVADNFSVGPALNTDTSVSIEESNKVAEAAAAKSSGKSENKSAGDSDKK